MPAAFLALRFLDPVDQFAFDVRLAEHDVEAEALGGRAAKLLDVGERGAAVFLRLARAEQVQIGAVEDVDGLGHGIPAAGSQCDARETWSLYRWPGGEGKPAGVRAQGAFAGNAWVSRAAQSTTSLIAVNLAGRRLLALRRSSIWRSALVPSRDDAVQTRDLACAAERRDVVGDEVEHLVEPFA